MVGRRQAGTDGTQACAHKHINVLRRAGEAKEAQREGWWGMGEKLKEDGETKGRVAMKMGRFLAEEVI